MELYIVQGESKDGIDNLSIWDNIDQANTEIERLEKTDRRVHYEYGWEKMILGQPYRGF